jgi:FKBP-type peptidyl-prolyl cis-trans isomerase
MKSIFTLLLIFIGTAVFAGGIAEEAAKGNEKANTSYAFGMLIGGDLMDTGLAINYDAFIRGLRDVMENQKTQFSMDEAMDIINIAFMSAQAEISGRNLREGEVFLAENAKRPEVTVTPSGLQLEIISDTDGVKPGPGDVVLVHYRGATINGTVFDSTYEYGEPAWIPLDRVIPGWSEGIRMMKEGSTAKLYIPPHLAYGEYGAGAAIGPNAVLIFDVELIEIMRPLDN